MTWMPRSHPVFRPAVRAAPYWKRLAGHHLAWWHAACFALGTTGCLYVGPINLLVDENVKPEIEAAYTDVRCKEQYPELVDPVCIYPSSTGEGTKVFVIARDENDDALEFTWFGSQSYFFDNAVPSSSGEFQSSELELTPDDVHDGEQLTCTVSDGSESDERTWTLVVFE